MTYEQAYQVVKHAMWCGAFVAVAPTPRGGEWEVRVGISLEELDAFDCYSAALDAVDAVTR